MNKELTCIMLVDDNSGDNYYHTREIKKISASYIVIQKTTGLAAIQYLVANKDNHKMLPDLIFLDINMPVMDGWEFLDSYEKLDNALQDRVLILLSTSDNSEDVTKAMDYTSVSDYLKKPLTEEIMADVIHKHFHTFC